MGFFSAPEVKARDMWTKSHRQNLLYPMVEQAGTDVSNMFNLGYNPYAYQGEYAAGTQPMQQQYYDMTGQVAQQQLGGLQGIANSQAPMDAMYDYGQRYAQDVLTPQVMERFAGMGTEDSGGAMTGLARELGTYGLGLNSQIGQMGLQNQAQQLQAYNQMGQIPSMLGNAASQQYGVAQNQVQGNIARSQALDPYSSMAYQQGMGLLGMNSGQPTVTGGGLGYGMAQGFFNSVGSSLGNLFG